MRTLFILLIGLMPTVVLCAQDIPPPKDDKKPTVVDIMVTGCLHGEMLVEARPSEADVQSWNDFGRTFRLKAPKSVMRAIKQHRGELADIHGTIDARQLGPGTKTGGVPVGKRGRFVFGAREDTNLTPAPFSPTVDVKEFTPRTEKCQ